MSETVTFEIEKEYAEEVAHLLRWAVVTQNTSGGISPRLYAIASELDPVDFTDWDYILYGLLYNNKMPRTKEEREETIEGFKKRMND